MTSTSASPGPRPSGVTERLLIVLASFMPWADQSEAAARWVAEARAGHDRVGDVLFGAARAVITADRRSPDDPGLTVVVALGRLRVAAALAACAVLCLSVLAAGWILGEAIVLMVAAGVFGAATATGAVVVLFLAAPTLGARGRSLFLSTGIALAALMVTAMVSAFGPSEATLLAGLSAVAAAVCALSALSWSAHLGPARVDHGPSPRILPLTIALAAVAVGCVAIAVVVRPALAVPTMSLTDIYVMMDESGLAPSLASSTVIGVAMLLLPVLVLHLILTRLARRNAIRSSSARALVAATAAGIVMAEWFVSFGTMMTISDIVYPPELHSDALVSSVLAPVCLGLAAIALLEGARHPFPSPAAGFTARAPR